MAKTIIQEIEDIVKEQIKQMIQPIVIPDTMSVEVSGVPETPKIDFSGLEKALVVFASQKRETLPQPDFSKIEALLNGILNLKQPDNSELLGQILQAVNQNKPSPIDFTGISDELRGLVEEVRNIKQRPQVSGGAIGPSKIAFKNKAGRVVDPAVAISDGETLSTVDPQGTLIAGKRNISLGNKVGEYIGVAGIQTDALKVLDENNHILKEIVVELKAIKHHQAYLSDQVFDGTE